MSVAKMPRILDILNPADFYLYYEAIYRECELNDCTISGDGEKIALKQMIFRNVCFKEACLRYSDIVDVIFINCDLSNIDFRDSSIHRTEFIDCKILGTSFTDTSLVSVAFKNCNGKYTNFRFSKLKDVEFEKVSLESSDFLNSKFTKVKFKEANLTLSQFSGTSLMGIDFTSSVIDGINARVEDINGVVITIMQSVEIAKIVGAVIKV
ncbi:MAG TPA: pentapeptide repeat-containing protein [Clostridiaceae bacterium]